MFNTKQSSYLLLMMLFILPGAFNACQNDPTPQQKAHAILEKTGVKGGLIVCLGCTDGKLVTALHANERYLVQGLSAHPENVNQARQYLHEQGIYGRVTVELLTNGRLPYIENLADLVVIRGSQDVSTDEVMRVLSPGGVVCRLQKGNYHITTKPRPEDTDDWTHFLHGADNNPVSRDARIGPPRQMQWLSDPMWCRNHHTLASISSVVSTGGRIFYIADQSPAASIEIPSHWSLIARDAYNGKKLWEKRLPSWANHLRRFRSGPVQLPRLLVAHDNRVYAPLGEDNILKSMNAATGEILQSYQQTKGVEELIVNRGVIYAVTGKPVPEQMVSREKWLKKNHEDIKTYPNQKTIKAFQSETGKQLWKWSDSSNSRYIPLTLAATGDHMFFRTERKIFCLDQHTGRINWSSSGRPAEKPRDQPLRIPGWSVASLLVEDGVALSAYRGALTALEQQTGNILWRCPCEHGFHSPPDIMAINGEVWIGGHWPGSVRGRYGDIPFSQARDLQTGKLLKSNSIVPKLWTAGHHHRCYRNKATTRYIMTGKRGIEFIDVDSSHHSRNNWVRGVCQYGIMPANGLIYAPPHACGCYMESKLYGFWALAPGSRKQKHANPGNQDQLERGAAYGKTKEKSKQQADEGTRSWPSYRHDFLRSGSAHGTVPVDLTVQWKKKIGVNLTQPVIADGRVFVSSQSTHQIKALKSANGKDIWCFTADGPVDSPPTIYQNLVIFGSTGGSVYCLRANDGKLVWRFSSGFNNRQTVVRDHLESVWPVHGSVLVQEGIVYFAAGRSSYLDGGIWIYGLDPETGKVLHKKQVQSKHPDYKTSLSRKNAGIYDPSRIDTTVSLEDQNAVDWKTLLDPDHSDAFSMSGAINDVLVGDGQSVYMKQLRFDKRLDRQSERGSHLFSTSRLLDGSEVHRTHWVLGTGEFSRLEVAYPWIANQREGRDGIHLASPYGLMLTFNKDSVWGIWRRYQKPGYLLWADKKHDTREKGLHDFRKIQDDAGHHAWSEVIAMHPRSMVKSRDHIFLGGTQDVRHTDNPYKAYKGEDIGILWVMDAANGKKRAGFKLDAPPVWDGMAVAEHKLFVALKNGTLQCLGK